MPLTLHVDGDRWRAHLRATLERRPGLVPVLKGNGYGFGLARLARRAQWLGVDTVAVGTYQEIDEVAHRFDGSMLVLTPWRPGSPRPGDPRVVHTVGRHEDLQDLVALGREAGGPRPRVVLELLTSMRRHGFTARGLREAVARVRDEGGVTLEGIALHLPLSRGGHATEVERLMTDVVAADAPSGTVWVSHLTDDELAQLATRYPQHTPRLRSGTELWLGERGALRVSATVLDVHPLERGDVYGYRGRSAPRAGWLVVVSGGTAHGIGLEAPTGEMSVRSRAASLARGGLDAAGMVRSPFTVDGKVRLFAEPPHMQASMLFLPRSARVPAIGDEVDVRVRHTATDVDVVDLD